MWNVRMRASKEIRIRLSERGPFKSGHRVHHTSCAETHVSGAEGLYEEPDIRKAARSYIARALNHPRGRPDSIIITLERLKQKPLVIQSLPLTTVRCGSPSEASRFIKKLLHISGISGTARSAGLRIVRNSPPMRGAALIASSSGRRTEADKQRGIRVSRLGITRAAGRKLSFRLSRHGINSQTVREALILASKVASCNEIMAEICISDDPDYTTGYISSPKFGYVRIPNAKRKGSGYGGRVFFVHENADTDSVVAFLEKTPTLIDRISACKGAGEISEFLDNYHR